MNKSVFHDAHAWESLGTLNKWVSRLDKEIRQYLLSYLAQVEI